MAELRPHYIDVDLKKNTQYNVPVVTQNDTATHFIIRVTDDGLSDPELLDAYQEITMTSQRPDGESFYLTGTRIPGTNEIEFHLGTDETAFSGSVLASLQFYLVEDASRYTSAQFRYDVKKDLTKNYTPTQREETLVEVVLKEGPGVIQEAKDATAETRDTMATLTGAVDGALSTLDIEKDAAIGRLDEVTEENKTVFRQPVNAFADLATTYPNPEHGTTVRVTGESATYRYSDGSWVKTDEYNPTAIDQVTAQLAETATKAETAEQLSQEAKTQSISTQNQLDTVVLSAGDSSAEAAQARVDIDGVVFETMKERIDNEQKKIEKVIDSQLNATNEVKNGDFSEGLAGWAVFAGQPYVDEAGHLVVNSTGTSSQVRRSVSFKVNHKYYVSAKVNCTRYVKGGIGLNLGNVAYARTGVTSGIELVSVIYEANSDMATLFVGAMSSADLDGFVDDVLIIDLTETFGESNEPSKEVFEKLLKQYNHWFDGEKSIVDKMLYGLVLNPSTENQVEVDVAKQAFIDAMNQKAQQIGMINTNYVNPTGLEHINQTSTAKDTVLLGINAAGHDELVKVWNKKSYTFNVSGRQVTINTSVTGTFLEDHYYIFGGKTGTNSGDFETNNLLVIVEAPNDNWFVGSVIKTSTNRYIASKELFDIAKLYMEEGYEGTHDVRSETAAVCLMPKHNPLAYEGYEIPMLWGKNEDVVGHQASITKVMTAIVMLEYIHDLNERFEVIESDIMRGSGPTFFAGDVVTFRDALYNMMLPSSNTMAEAVCRVVGEKIARSK